MINKGGDEQNCRVFGGGVTLCGRNCHGVIAARFIYNSNSKRRFDHENEILERMHYRRASLAR